MKQFRNWILLLCSVLLIAFAIFSCTKSERHEKIKEDKNNFQTADFQPSSISEPDEINLFISSSEYASFSSDNNSITRNAVIIAGQVRNDQNQLLNQTLTTIHIPVMYYSDTAGVIIGTPMLDDQGQRHYLISYQDNTSLIRERDGSYQGTIRFESYESSITFEATYNSNGDLVSENLSSGPRIIRCGTPPTGRVWPSWDCVDHVMDSFNNRCTGGCRFMCEFSNAIAMGACTGGKYLGAAAWCSGHNNNWQVY